jgi:L-malate glycosyltransferase
MRHILFLPSWYPNRIYIQNGDFIQRHAEAVALYCRVAVLHVASDPEVKNFNIACSRHKEIFEVRVYFPKTSSFFPWKKLYNYRKAHRLGYKAILAELGHIDLVHLNVLYKAGLFALELKERYKIPYIVTEHWTAFLPINPLRFTFFEKWSIRKIAKEAALICPVSLDLTKALQSFGLSGPFEVVPNVVDTALFDSKVLAPSATKKILHISSLNDPHKNVSGLLRTTQQLSLLRNDFSLSIVGHYYLDRYQQMIEELGLSTIVTLHGTVPHEEIATLMQAHDFFVLFSNFENLPCVIIEAQASGLPVVATDVGGVSEMVNEKNGLLVPAGDEKALLKKLNQMLDTLSEYDRDAIRAQAIQRYSYEKVGERFKNIYEEVLSRKA